VLSLCNGVGDEGGGTESCGLDRGLVCIGRPRLGVIEVKSSEFRMLSGLDGRGRALWRSLSTLQARRVCGAMTD